MTLPTVPVAALAIAGKPPTGLMLIDRNRDHPPGPWFSHAPYFNSGRVRPGDWAFIGVDSMRPENWRTSLAHALDVANSKLASGVLVNPEAGWPTAPASDWNALRSALELAAARTRIGVVSHVGWPIERLGSLGGLAWGSPELFFSVENTRAGNAHAWERWRSVFGFRLVPCITTRGGMLHPRTFSPREQWSSYEDYLASIPHASGAVLFPGLSIQPDELDALRAHYATPPAVALMLPLTVVSTLDTWPGLVLLVLVLVLAATMLARRMS